MDCILTMWTLGNISARRDLGKFGIQVMPHSGLMPSMPALQQAMREPLARAPQDHNKFAVYIFERAREIDHEWALTKTLTKQRARSISKPDYFTMHTFADHKNSAVPVERSPETHQKPMTDS